jgi:phage terminase Nu1 subunit (DNA packaging protein)
MIYGQPDEQSTVETVSPFGNKRDVAAMLKMSVRSVDNYIAAGCPVIKLSPRRCRFDLAEVRAWFKRQYGQQRRGKLLEENIECHFSC